MGRSRFQRLRLSRPVRERLCAALHTSDVTQLPLEAIFLIGCAQCTDCLGALATFSPPVTNTVRVSAHFERRKMKEDVLIPILREILQNQRELEKKFVALVPSRQDNRQLLSVAETAAVLNRRPFTVREWCRTHRVLAEKALSGRGRSKEWRISRDEIDRIQNEGLLPPH